MQRACATSRCGVEQSRAESSSFPGGLGHLQGVGRLCGSVAGTPRCVSCRNHLSSAHFALANGYFTRGDLEDGLCHAREEGLGVSPSRSDRF